MSTLQINKTKYKQFKIAAIGSSAVLVLGGLAFFQPLSLTDNSYAESSSLDMSVTLNPTISIWTTDTNNNASNQVDISTNPDETVSTGTIRTHVSTNNLTGYTLTIQSNSNDAKMKHENTSITKTIDPLTGNGTSSSTWADDSSLNNMWGYSIGTNDSFVGVPSSTSSATTINSSSTPSLDSYTDTTFGTKVDLNIPAGTYGDTVVFSAVANVVPNSYMQDFTKEQCQVLPIWQDSSDDITLIDKRDNNSYTIRKLADGNCWMVNNLKLGSTSAITLYNTDTDIADSSWDLPASSAISSNYYDNAQIHVGTSSDSGWVSVYGNYYNWAAATAGQGTSSTTSGNINVSICPKGWKFPTGGSNGQFQILYTTYGFDFSDFQTATLTGTSYLAGHFVNGSLMNAGGNSRWWSRTAYSSDRGYSLYSDSSGINSQDHFFKYLGFPVRCLLSAE